MMDSKINSTLKVGICMRQVDGERNFTAPQLRSAQVFGGIAGIIGGEVVKGKEEVEGRMLFSFSFPPILEARLCS